jgi:hypothetical protein
VCSRHRAIYTATALFQMADARIKRYFTDQDGVPHIQLNSGEPISSCEVHSEQLKAYLRKLKRSAV